jgi:hypothetical protein
MGGRPGTRDPSPPRNRPARHLTTKNENPTTKTPAINLYPSRLVFRHDGKVMHRKPGFKDFFLLSLVWLGGILLYGFQRAWFGTAHAGEASIAWGRKLVKRPGG